MIRCIIFDLDNTLFDQVDYIKGLMRHIAAWLSKRYKLDQDATTNLLVSYWLRKGPFYGHFFNDIVDRLSIDDKKIVKSVLVHDAFCSEC